MHGRFLKFLWKSRFEIKLQCWFEITDLSKIICVCEKCKEHIYCLNTLANKYFKTGVWECALLKKTDLPRSGMGYIINGFFTNTAIFEYGLSNAYKSFKTFLLCIPAKPFAG